MGQQMSRGKQQVLYTYLPTNTFDFQGGTIARVASVRGTPANELNPRFLLTRIREDAEAWPEPFRPALRDATLHDPGRFSLLNPYKVEAEFFPRVFWCNRCGRVYDLSNTDRLPSSAECPRCDGGRLSQLRFVLAHRCGAIRPLTIPSCSKCNGRSGHMALVTHGSERVSEFQWVCRRCGTSAGGVFGGFCSCEWPGETDEEQRELRKMAVLVHRAGPTFYPRSVTLLNIPQRQLDGFFALGDLWPRLAAAKLLELPEVADRRLDEFRSTSDSNEEVGLSKSELDTLMGSGLSPAEIVAEMERLRTQRTREHATGSPQVIADLLVERTGVAPEVWDRTGQEMLEGVMPLETGHPRDLFGDASYDGAAELPRRQEALRAAERLGLSRLLLADDFPIVKGTYAFTRLEPSPYRGGQSGTCRTRLNAFPPQPDTAGRLPIFVDDIRADALLLTLDAERVLRWLERNDVTPALPPGNDPVLTRRAYPVQLLDDAPLRQTLADSPQRMVFGLLHTLSHLAIRQAALLCGLDRTSLSEYLLPRALTAAVYCNHRFGATIGALTSLFEQALPEWLDSIRNAYRCVYDPVCREHEGACHACAHLAETSCSYFNINLSRAFLFGGHDSVIGEIRVGYFDPSLAPGHR